MKLYGYFRSSAAYRVRIALNLKKLAYQSIPVNLREGKQLEEAWLSKNPQGLVPVLELPTGEKLNQSLAIIEWLDENYPNSSLLPGGAVERAQIRAFSGQIACDIHPLNNLRVLGYLENTLNVAPEGKKQWYQHWIKTGFSAIEIQLAGDCFCFGGDKPTLADVCLIPQVYNALRFDVNIAAYPKIRVVYEHCTTLSAFSAAAPEHQEDAI